MTNKPMLSVERELLERILDSIGFGEREELKAILDNQALESQYDGMTQAQAQAVSDGVDEILHDKPAVQHQGDPVVGHCTHPPGCKFCSWCGFKAEQPAPVADGTTSNKYKAELYDEVWQKARDMGFANVSDALAEVARLNGVKP